MTNADAGKHEAWNAIGLAWYKRGRKSGKPSKASLSWYTQGLGDESVCLVVGGTSVDLIRAARGKGSRVVVADFSERICSEVAEIVPDGVEIAHLDVLEPPEHWLGKFDRVCSDTLINRFDWSEFQRYLVTSGRLLKAEGSMRTIVKVGLYEMDHKLLAEAARRGVPTDFWEDGTKTMDYEKAANLLEAGLVKHGSISRRDLIAWYSQRGREKRFDLEELRGAFGGAGWVVSFEADSSGGADRVRISATKGD